MLSSEIEIQAASTESKQPRLIYMTLTTCLIFCVFAFADGTLGPILTPLSSRLHISLESVGLLSVCWSTGYLPGALIGGAMLDRYGPRLIFLLASLIVLSGFTALYISMQFQIGSMIALLSLAGLAGTGGGVIDASTNGLISNLFVRHRGRALNLFNMLYPLSGALLALIDTGLLTFFHNDPLPPLLFTIGFALIAMLLLPGMPGISDSYQQKKRESHKGTDTPPITSLLLPLLPVVVSMIFINGITSSLRSWTPTYLHVAYALSPASASAISSLVVAVSILGRLAAALIVTWVGPWRVVILGVLITLCGLIAMLFTTTNIAIGTIATTIATMGVSPIFATLLTIGSERVGRAPGVVAGIMLFATGIGTIFSTWFFGFLLTKEGAVWPIIFCIVFIICGGLVALRLKPVRNMPGKSLTKP